MTTSDPFSFLAQVQLLTEEEEVGPEVLRPLTGYDYFSMILWQTKAVAALVAPPGHKVEALRVVDSLLTHRAGRYAPPQSETLNPRPEAD